MTPPLGPKSSPISAAGLRWMTAVSGGYITNIKMELVAQIRAVPGSKRTFADVGSTDTPSAKHRRLPSMMRYCRRSPHTTMWYEEPPILRYSPISLEGQRTAAIDPWSPSEVLPSSRETCHLFGSPWTGKPGPKTAFSEFQQRQSMTGCLAVRMLDGCHRWQMPDNGLNDSRCRPIPQCPR